MNREERRRTIVGFIVLVLMILAAIALFSVRNNNEASEKYVVIASFPERLGLNEGDDVVMNGAVVGAVRKLSDDNPTPSVAVRMKVSGPAFDAIGQDATAWIEYSTPEQKARLVIEPGKADKRGRFIKIKPVHGIETPQKESGQ